MGVWERVGSTMIQLHQYPTPEPPRHTEEPQRIPALVYLIGKVVTAVFSMLRCFGAYAISWRLAPLRIRATGGAWRSGQTAHRWDRMELTLSIQVGLQRFAQTPQTGR